MGQEARHIFPESSVQGLTKLKSKRHLGLQSHLRLEVPPKLMWFVVVGQIHFLVN